MSEKKMFTAEEVARMLLEKAHNTLKKHEEFLQKSKNTAHEIDVGEEFNNDDAECPDSLKGEGNSSASKSEPKKEKSPAAESEDSEMEDEPLSDSDSNEDESEEDEEKEDKFEFKKSSSGMHTVQYKTLKKFGSQGAPMGPSLGASIAAGLQGVKKDENKDMTPDPDPKAPTHIGREREGEGKSKKITDAQKKGGWGQAVSPKQKTTNMGQYQGIKAAQEKRKKQD